MKTNKNLPDSEASENGIWAVLFFFGIMAALIWGIIELIIIPLIKTI